MTAQTFDKRKHLTILKSLYSGRREEIDAAHRAQRLFSEEESHAFYQFQIDAGNTFVAFKDELDAKLDEIADCCPEEPDPRKWTGPEWQMFEAAIEGYEHADILRTYASSVENIKMIWSVIEDRLGIS